jgi:hypothetical protein
LPYFGASSDYVSKERCPRHLTERFSIVWRVPSVGTSLDYVPEEWFHGEFQYCKERVQSIGKFLDYVPKK